jgi:hypothetical protein
LDYYSKLGALFENDCHSLSRADCYLKEEDYEKLDLQRQRLETEYLFIDAVPCAAKVFGPGDDNSYVDLEEGSSQITGKGEKYLYLRFTPKTEALHSFTIQTDSSNFDLAYDFSSCNGRTNIINRPNKDDGYCQFFTQLNHVDLGDFDSTGPIYIGIKLVGNATVKITTKEIINLTGEGGSIETLFTDSYQSYKYVSDDIGYILINTATKKTNNDIQLYHNTEDCRKDKTIYPRPSHYCMVSSGKDKASLIIPSLLGNGQLHYFGIQIGTLDRVEFKYDFVSVTEVEINKEGQYEFDNTVATPFQVKVKKGNYDITVQSTTTNECSIYADYDGCNYHLVKLPNKRSYCLSGAFNKSQGSCTLSFSLVEDGVVYFGVETAIKRDMTVLVKSSSKLAFLE